MKALLTIVLLLLMKAATTQVTTATEQQLENLVALQEEGWKEEGWVELMQDLLQHPLAINTATEAELQQLPWLHPLQIQNLLQYRKSLGPLIHPYELQAVPGWDPATIKNVIPFITVAAQQKFSVKEVLNSGSHHVIARTSSLLQTPKGYDRSQADHFAGSKMNLTLRYRFRYRNTVQWGWTGDKDAGEPLLSKNSRGFDFNSFHVFVKPRGIIQSIAVGDYTINLGQGLIHWQSLAFKKSSEVLSVKRQSAVVRPYQSSGAFYFNRGLAITVYKNKWSGSLFFSSRQLDAHTDSNSIQQKFFTAFATSGLHRTKNEISDATSVHQLSYGGTLHRGTAKGKIGVNAVRHLFSLPMEKKGAPYQLFAIQGRSWMNISTDYNYTYRNFYFFGEVAADQQGAFALLQGLLVSLDKKADLSLLHRYIENRYQSLYGNAFTEQALPSNENGSYMGLRIRPSVSLRVDAYADFFRFPWLRFRVAAPSSGTDYLLQLTYKPQRQTELYVRYRREQKDMNEPAAFVIPQVLPVTKAGLRVHAVHDLTSSISLKTRMEAVWYDPKGSFAEHGFLFYVEGALKLRMPIAANFRFQFFETGGFNSRIYAYESDVLYGFSIPASYDKGFRFYAHIKYDVLKQLSCWLRFAQTVYSNRADSGSGLNLIKGNTVSEAKIQASYRF